VLDLWTWQGALIGAGVAVGALVQGSVGFGFALVAAPVMALIAPSALPATALLLGFPLNLFVVWRERAHADLHGFPHIVGGLVAGTAGGAAIMTAMPSASLSVLFGGAIVSVSALSALRPMEHHGHAVRVAAGTASGLINTVAGTGGPPLALLYQRRPGPQLRSTLALAFLIALVLSVIGVAVAGRLGWEHVRESLALVPALAIGAWSSRYVSRWLDERWLRPAVLAFAAASGAAALMRGLL
jgi:hypothetical protein